MSDNILTTEEVFNKLKDALQKDKSYAHSWHCNLAMSFSDAADSDSTSHWWLQRVSNDAASRFMKTCFDIETSDDMLEAPQNDDEKVKRICELEGWNYDSPERINAMTALDNGYEFEENPQNEN